MLDTGRRTTSAHKMNPSDQNLIDQPAPGRLSCDSYASYDIRDYGDRVRKSAEYYSKFRQSWSGPLVADAAGDEEGEFGFSTQPMWGPTSPSASPLPPQRKNNNNHYRNLSPASKTQAIARGQRELMEMVSKMPESCYELSLRDLVEQQPVVEEKEKQEQESEKGLKKKKNEKKMEMEIVKKKQKNGRASNNNEGFLLKMVFPVAFGVKNKDKKKKKKKKSELGLYSFKIAPRPPVVEGSDKAVDKEWWKKRFEQSESESSGSSSHNGSRKSSVSSNSSSSLSRNSSRHKTGGCLSFCFFRNNKSKNVK